MDCAELKLLEVCTMRVQAKKKLPQAKWTSSVVKLEHIKSSSFEIK
jgi:hypothetical protein